MKVIALGTGDAFTTERNNTALLIEHDGFYLAVDCPHPYLRIVKDKVNIEDINNVIITHLHGDHVSGLDTFLFYRKFVQNKTTNIHAINSVHRHLNDLLATSMGRSFEEILPMGMFYHEWGYNSNDTYSEVGPFKMMMKTTKHYIPATALLVGLRSEHHWRFGFSGDTAFDLELLEWLDRADTIFHETGPAPGHSPLDKFSLVAKSFMNKVKFIHYSDSINIENSRYAFIQDGEILEV